MDFLVFPSNVNKPILIRAPAFSNLLVRLCPLSFLVPSVLAVSVFRTAAQASTACALVARWLCLFPIHSNHCPMLPRQRLPVPCLRAKFKFHVPNVIMSCCVTRNWKVLEVCALNANPYLSFRPNQPIRQSAKRVSSSLVPHARSCLKENQASKAVKENAIRVMKYSLSSNILKMTTLRGRSTNQKHCQKIPLHLNR